MDCLYFGLRVRVFGFVSSSLCIFIYSSPSSSLLHRERVRLERESLHHRRSPSSFSFSSSFLVISPSPTIFFLLCLDLLCEDWLWKRTPHMEWLLTLELDRSLSHCGAWRRRLLEEIKESKFEDSTLEGWVGSHTLVAVCFALRQVALHLGLPTLFSRCREVPLYFELITCLNKI